MQKCRAQATEHIDVAPEILWSTIAEMTGMEDWYPALIAASAVDTSQKTPTRVCQMQDSGELHERILLRDNKTRTFVYAIDKHPLPAVDVVGTIRVDPVGSSAQVTWDAQFMTDPAVAPKMIDMITGMYQNGLNSLANFHKS